MTHKLPYLPAPIPELEDDRLEVLKSYELLDTLPEQEYDDLAALAAQICGVPIALLTLVDETRQWFKAAVGTEVKETPRNISFCGHAIVDDEPLIVEDMLKDARFEQNPLVRGEPNIRFYAGFQLRGRGGHALGTLCVLNDEPHALQEDQLIAMRALARQAGSLLELRLSQRELARLLQQARDANAARAVLSYALSHEMRTPLNAVLGYSDLIMEDADANGISEDVREDVRCIQQSAGHLLELIEDVLTLEQLELFSKFEPEPLDMRVLFNSLAERMLPIMRERGNILSFEIAEGLPTSLMLDEDKLYQLLVNLLSFIALRGEGGQVCARAEPHDEGMRITILDPGPTLDDLHLARIFEPFEPASRPGKLAKKGLSLTLSHRLVGVLQGSIDATRQGDDTLFTIVIPTEAAPE